MNIFITGSNGFIGLHLKEYLKNNYPQYVLFAPSSTELDLVNEQAVDSFILLNNIDIIIHLAYADNKHNFSRNITNVIEYNLRMFFNIVKHEKYVKKIISFGSGAEYGKHKPIINAKEEDYLLEQPLDEYGFYKSITSKYIEKCEKIIQLRTFGVYGEYENYRYKFVANAIVKNLLHLPITIIKNDYFDYIYIQDLIKMIDWTIHNETQYKIYNATSGNKIDLLALADIINESTKFYSEIKILNSNTDHEYSSNNIRIINEMGCFNFISHKEAIQRMIEYFKLNLNKLDKKTVQEDFCVKKVYKLS